MDKKTLMSYVAFGGGLALIVACLFIWRGESTPDNVFILNLLVSVAAYSLFFGNLFLVKPVSKDNDSKVGSWGAKWITVTLYPILAIAALLLLKQCSFALQLMVQLGLVFLVVLSFLGVFSITSKVQSVAQEQKVVIEGVQTMKRAMSSIQDALIDSPDVPGNYRQKISEIEQALRFISPSDSVEARELESKFVQIASEIEIGLSSFHMNRERLETALLKLDRVLMQRKNTYSN